MAKHFFGTPFAALPVTSITLIAIELSLPGKSKTLAPSSINHLRSYLIFIRQGHQSKFLLQPKPSRLSTEEARITRDAQLPERARSVARIAQRCGRWLPLFATAIYTGLRKGELLGLQVRDIDLPNRLLTVTRSYGRSTTKNWRGAVISIAAGLVPYLEDAIRRAPS